MIFHQLFDRGSSAYTYLIGDPITRDAVLVDPLHTHVALYLSLLKESALSLIYVLETHIHSDHVTGAAELQEATGARIGMGRCTDVSCVDVRLDNGDRLAFGNEVIEAIATPGHTRCCMSYLWRDRLLTGDTLLIGSCGPADSQGGDAGTLYDSVTRRLFTLPAETLVYPGHDYHLRHVSNIAQERSTNSRLAGKSRDEFVALMERLKPPKPKFMERTVSINGRCGKEDEPAR